MSNFPEEYGQGELACVGASVASGIKNTDELKPMKFYDVMSGNDSGEWEKAADKEHERMEKNEVFEAVSRAQVPHGAKILTSTWNMKQKADGTKRARVVARGFEQVDGEHYHAHSKAAPVVNSATIHVVMVLMIMA